MMRNFRKSSIDIFRIILILFAAALVSCSYKPTDEFYRDLKPVPPKVTITSTFGTDTIVMNNQEYFDIRIDPVGSYKFYMEILIDGVKRYHAQSSSGNFNTRPLSFLQPGIYPLHFNFYLNTKSGSFADFFGTEAFLYQKDMILVNNGYSGYTQYTPLTFANISGNLQCTLTIPPDGPPVRKIDVIKEFYSYPENLYFDLTSVTGSSPFIFYDDSYIGESAIYKVISYNGFDDGTYLYPYRSYSYYKINELQPPAVSFDNQGMPVIQWQKSAYESNCSGYHVFNAIYPDFEPYEIANIPDVNQTSVETPDIAFPGENRIYVSCVPKKPPPFYNQQIEIGSFSSSRDFIAGLFAFTFDLFSAPVGDDLFVSGWLNNIWRYSAQTLTVVDEISLTGDLKSFGVSPNSKYLVAVTGSPESNYLLYDITTSTITNIPGNQVIGSGISAGVVSISDLGVGAVAGGNKIILYDFVHQQKLDELSFTQPPHAEISPSGNYMFVSAEKLHLYSYSAGIITEIWHSTNASSGYQYFSFLPEDDNQAVILENQVLSVRHCEDWSLVRSFPTDFPTLGNIDYNSRRIVGYDKSFLKIYDFNTGNLLKQMITGTFYYPDLKIRGNALFSSGGRHLILF